MLSPEAERARRIRWIQRGALILALITIPLGLSLSLFVALVEGRPAIGSGQFWLTVLIGPTLLWGFGGAFFGAILGGFASMIWKPHDDQTP